MPTLREILECPEPNSETVAAALESLSSFEEGPSLQFMYLPPSAPIHFFKALENNQTITSLTLESHIFSEALGALITALKKNKHLKHLNIMSTASSLLLEELAQLLENNQTQIVKLSLGLSAVDLSGWIKTRTFARALEKNYTLTSLCIYGNDALIQVLESLRQNKTITELEVPSCIRKERVVPVLDSLLKENHTITKLKLFDPPNIPGIQETYDGFHRAIIANQIKAVMKNIQEALKYHKLREINPILNIIAAYVEGFPEEIEAIKPSEAISTPPPKQLSAVDKLKQKLRMAWNKLCLIIHNVWKALKNKFKFITPHTTQVPDNHTDKPVSIPNQIESVAMVLPTVQTGSQTDGVITELEASNESQPKVKACLRKV